VKIAYDSEQICLKKLLSLFFTIHDPTTPNRQGNDVGSQYRSIILYKKFVQENEIREFLEEMKGDYDRPIVTELKKLDKFWPAEEYHQHYFDKNPTAAYCQFVVAPKVEKIQNKIKE
jgi:peptide-methionine (S)-S-oxide reductase